MATNTTFANQSRLPVTGSQYPIGTAFLRLDPLYASGLTSHIVVGKCEKIGVKTSGAEIELEDEEGATEAYIMLNSGEEVSLTARFTKDVPSPVKGNFLSIVRNKRTLSHGTRPFTVAATATGGTKFTMATPTGYTVGEFVTVTTSTVSGYLGTWAVLATDGTSITLAVPFTATAAGNVSGPASSAVTLVATNVIDTFLITDVSEDYGSKEVAKYTLTAKKWDSLIGPNSAVASVTTATNALTSKENQPAL